ncbi:MAG: DNA polymerase elongation subunit [Candidatus Aenigmarchaeota archaeon]|nr:DNA polymerase elongation subunit [Candidatus Aenigmarchaeota archaeon]NIP39963.1 DNA polymerase elongation subunit [Candidatus Aenigmarchaeota archaeon]NIQ17682.1 DNA polymerase elongation subunit [Candidatus Aenigmarchaeota archaeon]NIS72870.1 DNA polymerase elongation subunit [Candidatus Aenigmarchaeota archaeon]
MLFQILDVDYTMVDEKPIIRIFGKTEDGETVCGFYEDYLPYFYARGEKLEEAVKGEGNVIRVEKVKRFLPIGYQKQTIDLHRITLRNPAKTPEIRDKLRSRGFEVFEADIPFKYRFMADFDLAGMGWIEVDGSGGVTTNTVSAQRKIPIKNFKKIGKDGMVPLRFLCLDIECVSLKEGEMPDSRDDPIIMISAVFSEPHKGERSIVLSTRSDRGVKPFEGEKEMLEELINIIMDYDPDVITGFNINNFDMPYILERMRQNNISPMFGRCKKHVTKNQIMSRFKINIAGRVMVDSFEMIKRDFSMKRYDLNTVSNELLGEGKEDVKKSQIEKFWKGSQEKFRSLIRYSKKDSELAMKLVLNLNLLDKYVALAKISGTLLQDILDSGETTRIENLILREFNKEDFVLPCKPDGSEVSKREKMRRAELKGGYVLEPEKGLHSSVIVLDFKAMYPSLIRTFNICPTTLIMKDGVEKPVTSPSGAKFVPENIRKGIIPKILERLMEERQKVKGKMKKESDSGKIRELAAEELALKIMSNAFYGHFGYPRAKVYSMEIANSITAFGRETIKKTKDFIEKDFGYKVIYGDTDSVMVKVPFENLEEIKKAGEEVAKRVTSVLKGVMELEFEKTFKRFLPLTKKRYAAWSFESDEDGWRETMETKGIETVRRDWCDLTSETIEKVLEIILKKNDIKEAVHYFKGVADSMIEGKIPIQKLVVTKTMTKRAEGYAGIQPHAELVKKIKKRSPAECPGVGDRIGYVIVKGAELLSKRAEDPLYVIEKKLPIDSRYYIENQLLPPLERIFIALGISKTELLGKGKQVSLFTAFANNSKAKAAKEVYYKYMEGFVCEKCYKTYDFPPLRGVCECGGTLLFNSPQGPARRVIY